MAFVRLKGRNINGRKVFYAYLVKNSWQKRLSSPRQSVSKYLGRVYELGAPEQLEFTEFIGTSLQEYSAKNTKARMIDDLVRWELRRHRADDIEFTQRKITKDGKEVVLKLNEGHMCSYTVRRLHNFSSKSEDPHYIGVGLAERFTEAGISVPRELFVLMFDKFASVTY